MLSASTKKALEFIHTKEKGNITSQRTHIRAKLGLTDPLADTSGRIVAAATMEDGTTAINVAQLPEGIYIATLKSDKELILSEKILVSHR